MRRRSRRRRGAISCSRPTASSRACTSFPPTPPTRWRARRCASTCLAPKGAAPLGFLLSIGLPAGLPSDWIKAFAEGLREDAEQYGCPLLGGDTDKSPGAITVYIMALGAVPHGAMVRRKGARPGDV